MRYDTLDKCTHSIEMLRETLHIQDCLHCVWQEAESVVGSFSIRGADGQFVAEADGVSAFGASVIEAIRNLTRILS